MKKSITKRMFIGITAVVVGFAIVILLANTLLLRPLYYNRLEKSLVSSTNDFIAVDFSSNRDIWINEIFDISTGAPYDVIILNNGIALYSSSMDFGISGPPVQEQDFAHERPVSESKPKEPLNPVTRVMQWEDKGNGISLGYSNDERDDRQFLVCTAKTDEGYTIILSHAVVSVDAGIAQSNMLLLICTGAVLLISILFAFRFSRGFTKPIKEIQGQVKKISEQDFSSSLEIATGDELESLGSDVNVLSEKLRSALLELQERNRQLEKDIKAQRGFISNASHELRTPLSLIKGYADELDSDFIINREQQKMYLGIISEESTKMKRLLNEMLDLSRLESGRMELNKEEFSIKEMLGSFMEKYSGFIKENRLDIELTADEDLSCLHDLMRFEQILANYVSNAAKYSDDRKKIIISAKCHKDMCRISVFNHGSSIDDESMEHIWDGFYKADNARTRSDDSYGLGLSIVKAIQTVAGYGYGAENQEDGVEFWFEAALV